MGVYKRFHGELMRHGRIRMEFHYTMGLLKNDAENRTATLDKIDKKNWLTRKTLCLPKDH